MQISVMSTELSNRIAKMVVNLIANNLAEADDSMANRGYVDVFDMINYVPLMAIENWDAVYDEEPPKQSALCDAINALELQVRVDGSAAITPIETELYNKYKLQVQIRLDEASDDEAMFRVNHWVYN